MAPPERPAWKTGALLALCIGGIYASYLTQGVLQEAMAIKKYGLAKDRFPHLKALNGVQVSKCLPSRWLSVVVKPLHTVD